MDLDTLNNAWPRCIRILKCHNYQVTAICETDTPDHYAIHYTCEHCSRRFMDKNEPNSEEVQSWIAKANEQEFLDGKFYYVIPEGAHNEE